VNIVQLLLENDADANIEGESRPRHLQLSNLWQAGPDGTALQLAGPMGLVEIVKLILESNADPNIKSETPQLFFELKTNLVSPRRPAWDRNPSSLM
jgi:ankyrin repeat protein